MRVALLDVHVLVALFDPASPSHETAHEWFARDGWRGWATSTITLNGCVRVLSNPAYPSARARPDEIVAMLQEACTSPGHQFWNDSVNLLDASLIRAELIGGHKNITDVSLLALALRNNGQLATFDRSISLRAVVGAQPHHLQVLGGAPR
jgi:toxin-antitoxin system PIN domain toxin